MKICLASIHPRRLSGQIESLVALARELEGLGHQTRVISAFDDDVLFRRNGASPEQHDDRGGDSPIGKLTRESRQPGCRQFLDADFEQEFPIHLLGGV